MPMTLVSVNVSSLQRVDYEGKVFETGIYKKPVQTPVRVHKLGLDGDDQGDKKAHGGLDMAVYGYTAENYDFWSRELGDSKIPHGKFGENLTTIGIDEADVCIGDRFVIGGEAELEVSLPRAPCSTLAMVMEDVEFPKRFLAALRVGFYMRVVREGTIRVGDAIERSRLDPARLSIAEVTRLMFFDKQNRAGIERAIGVGALAVKWRDRFQTMLQALPMPPVPPTAVR
jgi:MOSC domain-containing protein YiiM